MENKLNLMEVVQSGVQRGLQNAAALIVNGLLWVLTIWIPYLNVGTTIGLLYGVVVKMKNGETVEMTEIFDPVYRKKMGDMFLLISFSTIGTYLGFLFVIIPGIVLHLAWSQGGYLVLEKDMNPIEAIKKSNDITYGEKWTMFGSFLVVGILYVILAAIFGQIGGIVGGILLLALVLLMIPVMIGIQSFIYGKLSEKL